MATHKIFNDPVYGFVTVPYGIIFNLIEHPYFQRLRRIKQVSLTHYVYPGALHTRFHHALGAFHLMTQAIDVLRAKGADINDEESLAVQIAILLHDIGHGPFSHTLETTLINVHHERLSELFMQKLNEEFDGALSLAIQIFEDTYPKKFLHQLVSSQLDMDRMDYLTRDSFFTGVYEGVIGYDRIIKMLAVHEGELVVEEKGIYSIEKFLIARRLMYWQVYLHKTVLAAEQMLIQILRRAKQIVKEGGSLYCPPNLEIFIHHDFSETDFLSRRDELLDAFAGLDDYDIFAAIKGWMKADDRVLSFLSTGLINRKLFKLEMANRKFEPAYRQALKQKIEEWWQGPASDMAYLLLNGQESNHAYNPQSGEIKILFKNGVAQPMSELLESGLHFKNVTKYYLAYPKF
ncbi:HD domain-containing protein [Haliscomenobacter sp.]|uniref:HD domain-containing protein n=1 Tax=Haliscomenobacter sp. TaxID=2717303 RepID=UPI003364EC2D